MGTKPSPAPVAVAIHGTQGNLEPTRLKPWAPILIAAALGGCSTVQQTVGDPFVEPGKFQFLRCEDISKALVTNQNREQELRALMDRAHGGTGGSAVNLFVYEPDLQQVEASIRQLRQVAGEKRCGDEVIKAAPKGDISPLH